MAAALMGGLASDTDSLLLEELPGGRRPGGTLYIRQTRREPTVIDDGCRLARQFDQAASFMHAERPEPSDSASLRRDVSQGLRVHEAI
jgi:hypothetical protein